MLGEPQTGGGAQDNLTENIEFETEIRNEFDFNATLSIYFIFLTLYGKKKKKIQPSIKVYKTIFTGFI